MDDKTKFGAKNIPRFIPGDAELLERAAKAAGIDLHWDVSGNPGYLSPFHSMPLWVRWNPFRSAGDALYLVGTLDLFAGPGYWHHLAIARLSNNTDKHANVRRAIVSAAAALAPTGPVDAAPPAAGGEA